MSAQTIRAERSPRQLLFIVAASASGTVFEWYDFFVFGSLATIMSKQFFAGVNETAAFILALLTFGAGFAVRPLGALVFGRIGDRKGRKYAFLVTITLMGIATFAIGVLPNYASAGLTASCLLVLMRILQGFALGGEYGGAAIYLAEHAPPNRRGMFTGWVQGSASIGLVGALVIILVTRKTIGEDAFNAWGWRVPFLCSLGLLAISLWVRLRLQESPMFEKLRNEGGIAKAPITESFLRGRQLKTVLIALFSVICAQGVIWYTMHFYAQYFLERTLKVDSVLVNEMLIVVVLCSAPMYMFFAWLSDFVGRKYLMVTAIAASAVLIFPLFHQLTVAANPALAAAQAASPVTVVADPAGCSLQFDPVGQAKFVTSCDIAKSTLANTGVSYENEAAPAGTGAQIRIGDQMVQSFEGAGLAKADLTARKTEFSTRLNAALAKAGYPAKADPAHIDIPKVIGIMLVFMALATMLYGPMAAALVELFPTHIRYTALSFPYHIGTGWFGGFLPATAFAMVAASGNIYFGLWFPVSVSAVCAVVGLFFLPETYKRDINAI
jgi:MFS family permease